MEGVFELRPLWIIQVCKQSQDVCKCIQHENIDLICEVLINKAHSQKHNVKYKDVSTAHNIWEQTVCSQYNGNCAYRKCDRCCTTVIPNLFPFQNLEQKVEVVNGNLLRLREILKKDAEGKEQNQ